MGRLVIPDWPVLRGRVVKGLEYRIWWAGYSGRSKSALKGELLIRKSNCSGPKKKAPTTKWGYLSLLIIRWAYQPLFFEHLPQKDPIPLELCRLHTSLSYQPNSFNASVSFIRPNWGQVLSLAEFGVATFQILHSNHAAGIVADVLLQKQLQKLLATLVSSVICKAFKLRAWDPFLITASRNSTGSSDLPFVPVKLFSRQ